MSCLYINSAELQDTKEYYIWLNVYDKLLGSNGNDNAPALSDYGTNENADSYIL